MSERHKFQTEKKTQKQIFYKNGLIIITIFRVLAFGWHRFYSCIEISLTFFICVLASQVEQVLQFRYPKDKLNSVFL